MTFSFSYHLIVFFFVGFLLHSEVQAAMQMSQSWEESLSLVKNNNLSELFNVVLYISCYSEETLLHNACLGPGPLLVPLFYYVSGQLQTC